MASKKIKIEPDHTQCNNADVRSHKPNSPSFRVSPMSHISLSRAPTPLKMKIKNGFKCMEMRLELNQTMWFSLGY